MLLTPCCAKHVAQETETKMWFFKKKQKAPQWNITWLDEVGSTNDYMRQQNATSNERLCVVAADFQRKGRGQGSNTWESEPGKNLLFSIMTHPTMVPIRTQFLLSMAGALALKQALDAYTDSISLKWPNDVYWHDRKISGTLIETSIANGHIKDCVFGVGLNVNQMQFCSDAPNPISLAQIVGHEIDRRTLLNDILTAFDQYYRWIENGQYADLSACYHAALYRRKGFHTYRDTATNETFEAAIIEVEDDGTLVLRTPDGHIREAQFKAVEHVLPTSTERKNQ